VPAEPTVSVVTVTWNSASTIKALLDSVAATTGVAVDVVVVDNASRDETVAIASEHPLHPLVIANAHNAGLARANNQGMLAGSGDFFLISNPDVTLESGTLEALLACARRRSRAAFVLPRLLHPNGQLQPAAGDMPRFLDAYAGRNAAHRRGTADSGMWWDGWAHDEERVVGHGNEACYLVRRSAVAEIGPQDERYFLDWEGVDWSARAAALGWEVWFCPEASVEHIGEVSIRQAPRMSWIFNSHRGMYYYFADRLHPLLRPFVFVAIGARLVAKTLAIVLGRTLPWERGSPA
jgi:N-acetylglucosaminyl-diphospho-decaprenol L-rhamnosyltransferase